MTAMRRTLPLFLVTALALSACTDANRELGAGMDHGTFGNATMNNTLVQSGQMDVREALGRRFAADVPSTITFPFNSAQLTTEARRALDHQANWMRQFPELRFSVYGHTDLVGSEAYNRALGKRRAQAVVAYLASRGVSTTRLEALVSYGETRPVIVTLAPEQRNRRTVTEVSGFAQGSQA
ncbi:MAG: OmpA family protein, partial [Gemmobacter sp.]